MGDSVKKYFEDEDDEDFIFKLGFKVTNEDHFKLRKEYNLSTGLKAFDKETVITYVNWLEKKILKKRGLPLE